MSDEIKFTYKWLVVELEQVIDVHDHLRKPINAAERQQRIAGKQLHELFPYYGATGQVGYIDNYLTDGNYVLIGEDAAPFFDHTKPVAYKISGKTWVNNHAHVLKPRISSDFCLHYLNSFNYVGYVEGTTRLKLTQGALKRIPFPLPPLAEQQRIVAKIEELFSELDKGIEALKTAQQQLKVYRQAVLKYAFEGRLTNPDVKEGELPEGWVEKTLCEVCDMKAGFFVKAETISETNSEGKYPCYGGNGLRGYVESFTHQGVFPIVGRQGALCGNVRLVEGTFHATEHAVVVTVKNSVNETWLYHKLRNMKLNNYSTGTAQPGLSVNKLLPLKLLVPQITEQIKTVSEIESRLSVCDKIEESIAQGLQQAEALRQSILKKAFEGKLVPQDSNDEPASVLLERIKAERAASKPMKKTRKLKEKA